MTEKTYTVLEATVLLNLSKQNVIRAINDGRLAASRLRDRAPWTITKRAIDAYIETRRVNPRG
jgi:excisionase family DNA binding protein